ncbi:MAG: alpha-amylase family glycosyl hydrolase, partial [Caulobacterales bacterium]|nr:alpha-amylase family glycosyl hydrolase [Caulobacterales bacterium]
RDNPVREDGARTPNPHDWQAHRYCRSQPENLAFLTRLRELADSYGDICLMGEVFDDDGLVRLLEYTAGETRLHTAYSFDFLTPRCDAPFLRSVLERWLAIGDGWPTWALGNHDVPRLATRWTSGAPTAAQLELFAAFQLCLAGTICLYQGEELGLEQAAIPFDKLQDPEGLAFWPEKPGRDGCRTPMPWAHDADNAGFTTAAEPWLPIPGHHGERAASRQSGVAGSTLETYRDLVVWRRGEDALRDGAITLSPVDDQVLAFARGEGNARRLCAFNFSGEPAAYAVSGEPRLRLAKGRGAQLTEDASAIRLQPWGWGAFAPAP